MLVRLHGAGERLAAKGETVPADEVVGVEALAGKRGGEHLLARPHGTGERLAVERGDSLGQRGGRSGGFAGKGGRKALVGPTAWGR